MNCFIFCSLAWITKLLESKHQWIIDALLEQSCCFFYMSNVQQECYHNDIITYETLTEFPIIISFLKNL